MSEPSKAALEAEAEMMTRAIAGIGDFAAIIDKHMAPEREIAAWNQRAADKLAAENANLRELLRRHLEQWDTSGAGIPCSGEDEGCPTCAVMRDTRAALEPAVKMGDLARPENAKLRELLEGISFFSFLAALRHHV